VEPVVAQPVAPEAVFSSVERARQSGELERFAADGSRSTGSFRNGICIPCEPELG